MGLVAADSVEDTPLVVSQNDVDIRELAVLLSSEMENQAWLSAHRRVAQERSQSSQPSLQHLRAELEQSNQEILRLRQDLSTVTEERNQLENALRQTAGVQDELRQAKEALTLAAETRRENELALEAVGTALRKTTDELQASVQELRIKDEENLQGRAEVAVLHRREKELMTDVDRQRSELRRVEAELDVSLGQNGRLLKELSGVKSNLQAALKVQHSNETALTAKEDALNAATLKLDVCTKDLCAKREELEGLEKVVSKMREDSDQSNQELERAVEQQWAFEEEAERLRCERDSLTTRLEQANAKLHQSDLDLSHARGQLREKERESGYKGRSWAPAGAEHQSPLVCVDWADLATKLPKYIGTATGVYMAVEPYFRRWGKAGKGIAVALTIVIVSVYIAIMSHIYAR